MEQQNQNLFDLSIDQQSFGFFSESAKWAKFIAIVGFVFCALLVVLAIFAGSILGGMVSAMGGGAASMIGSGVLTFIYIIFAAIYFFPCLYLYRFASHMQVAVHNNEQAKLHSSLKNLKSFFRFIGILLIILLSLYALVFLGMLFVGIGGAMAS